MVEAPVDFSMSTYIHLPPLSKGTVVVTLVIVFPYNALYSPNICMYH